jgi:DNA-binding IclR family transcriptional regulator
MKRPLASSVAGRVLLSAMPDEEIKRLYHSLNAYATSREQVVNVRELIESMKEIRRQGYLCDSSPGADGRGLIAVPLPIEAAGRPLVIGLGASSDDLKEREAEYLGVIREEIAAHLAGQVKKPGDGELRTCGQPVVGQCCLVANGE